MALNIKDPEAHRIAQALAKETGESMTEAVRKALSERYERVRRRRTSSTTAHTLVEIGKRCAADLAHPPVDHGALLYDDRGLPK
jgi:antitoxin VapB